MKIDGVIWLRNVVDKLAWTHDTTTDEVEEVFRHAPHYRFVKRGDVAGEDLYVALGQTDAGRYLIVYFVRKTTDEALIVSAREMTPKEKRTYGKR
jgi:uncharacterized DUF497 family protein